MIGRRARRAARGYSLIEVMVATMVLGAGIIATMPLVTYATQRAAIGRRETAAAQLAAQVLEQVRSAVQTDPARVPTALHGGLASSGTPLVGLNQMWNSFYVPHSAAASVMGPVPVGAPPCRAGGGDDFNVGSTVGPALVRHEGEDFYVCYNLRPGPVLCPNPGCTVPVIVKVLWRHTDGRIFSRRMTSSIAVIGT